MIKVYKHFNTPLELFWGLSFSKIIRIILLSTGIIILFNYCKLSPQNPLSLFIFIPAVFILAIIIKSEDDFYTNLVLHPFQDHIFLLNKKSKTYANIKTTINKIKDCTLYKNDKSICQIIKIDYGISIQNLNNEEQESILDLWSSLLSEYNKITNYDDYFANILLKEELTLHTSIKQGSNETIYYIGIHQDALNEDKSIIERFIDLVKNKLALTDAQDYNHKKELILLKEKVDFCKSYLNKMQINCKSLNEYEIKKLFENQVGFFSKKGLLIDKGNHLELKENGKKTFLKNYCLETIPDSGDLNFWLKDFFLRFKTNTFITIKFEYRDAYKDIKKVEQKAKYLNEFKKNEKAINKSIIQESQSLSKTLIERPYSFNLSIDLTIKCNTIDDLKEIDRLITRPHKNAVWNKQSRKQIKGLKANLLGSRINESHKKHYSDLALAQACFCFYANNFPTDSLFKIGKSLTDNNDIFFNEANKKLHKTRSINFIGDSGSGKSMAAKFMISQRLKHSIHNHFVIIDNSSDGWTDFCRIHQGEIIDLNQALEHRVYFNPLQINTELEQQVKNLKIQELLLFFRALSNNDELTLAEIDFLTKSLNAFFDKQKNAKLSDLYLFWSTWHDKELTQKWQILISPYCKITNGAYAYLLDGSPSSFDKQLTLFQFSKINQESNFSDLCMYLINQELQVKAQDLNKKITLVIDEAWKIFQSKKSKDFFSYYARAGRALECALWTISQKPTDLGREIYSNASNNISFHLKEKKDQEQLKAIAGFAEHELKLFTNSLLKTTGCCLIKSNFGTDLVEVQVAKEDLLICSSDKDCLMQKKGL